MAWGVTTSGRLSFPRTGIRSSGCRKHVQGRCPGPLDITYPISAECLPGVFEAGCPHSCRCLNGGLCDPHTGHCLCPAGWTGDKCQSREWVARGPMGEARRPLGTLQMASVTPECGASAG